MKKTYLPPFVVALPFAIECDIMNTSFNGSSLTNLTIVDETDDDDWTY